MKPAVRNPVRISPDLILNIEGQYVELFAMCCTSDSDRSTTLFWPGEAFPDTVV